jgi:hypothetical protein
LPSSKNSYEKIIQFNLNIIFSNSLAISSIAVFIFKTSFNLTQLVKIFSTPDFSNI